MPLERSWVFDLITALVSLRGSSTVFQQVNRIDRLSPWPWFCIVFSWDSGIHNTNIYVLWHRITCKILRTVWFKHAVFASQLGLIYQLFISCRSSGSEVRASNIASLLSVACESLRPLASLPGSRSCGGETAWYKAVQVQIAPCKPYWEFW